MSIEDANSMTPLAGMSPAVSTALPLDDIQGIVLRGYNFPAVRHFVLSVEAATPARKLVKRLAMGPDPQISTSVDWGAIRPAYRLQIGFTYGGLSAIGLEQASLAGFRQHGAFAQGMVARAAALGDVGDSAPKRWIGLLNQTDRVHILISLYATDEAIEPLTANLRALWAGSLEELSAHTGNVLPDHSVHFGYQDGISQPTIAGAPLPTSPSTPASPVSSFLLGYESPWPSFNLPVPPPDSLGRNGSFAAFRILKQDVMAFESFLTQSASVTGRDREWVAAKLCGRWRNGVPLLLSPDVQNLVPTLADERLDDFDYASDPVGERCPFGAHSRRAFPRSDFIAGGQGAALRHRIIRRGMPYGPQLDPAHPSDDERGLLGLFICASLEYQFEFILAEWLNQGGFTGALARGCRDPLVGALSDGEEGRMTIPVSGQPGIQLSGFQRFITTRGGAYVFFPSITALRYMGTL